MKGHRHTTGRAPIALVAAVAALAAAAGAASAATSVKPYVVPVGDQYDIKPLFSVDDKVPLLGGGPGQQYRMVGIPDGLGAHPNGDGTSTLFMNNELPFGALSEPVVGGPKNRGAIVSQWVLDEDGDPIAGRRAYDSIFVEDTFLGPAPEVGNEAQMPRQFSRYCSGFLAGRSTASIARSTSRTRRTAARPASMAGAASPSPSSMASSTRSPRSAAPRRRTAWSSRSRERAR